MICSIIIPAFDAEKTIDLCIKAALAQDMPQNAYEIIVVDDGSTDQTADRVRSYPVRLIQQIHKGPAAARNRGANAANGDILVFTDADCVMDQMFLRKIIAPMEENPDIVSVQGSYKTKQEEFIAKFVQVEIETRYNQMKTHDYIDFISTYAAAYKREIFLKSGGFDTRFTAASSEDTEFSYRLHAHGYKMVFAPEAFVYHTHTASLFSYLKLKIIRGYWAVRVYRMYPKKAVNNAYTPQRLKFQVFFLTPLCYCLLILYLLKPFFLILFAAASGMFIYYAQPFISIFREKEYPHKGLIPFVLFIRANALLLGVVAGVIEQFIARFRMRDKKISTSTPSQFRFRRP